MPNPAVGRARLRLAVAQPQHVRIDVYDVLGRLAAVVLDEEVAPHQVQEVNLEVDHLPAGVYVLRLEGEHFAATRPLTATVYTQV